MRDWEEKDFFSNTFNKSPHTDTRMPLSNKRWKRRADQTLSSGDLGIGRSDRPQAKCPRRARLFRTQPEEQSLKKSYFSNEESVITTSIGCEG